MSSVGNTTADSVQEVEGVSATSVEAEVVIPVLDEIVEENDNAEKFVGQCKWFSDKLGYGFLTICDGDKKGVDIFSHHSGIKPLNSNYKTLKKGEYVEFNIVNGMNGLQAVNVTGINGGALMCDFVTARRTLELPGPPGPGGVPPKQDKEGWQQVGGRKFTSSTPSYATSGAGVGVTGGAGAGVPRRKLIPNKYNKKTAPVRAAA